MQNKKPLKKIKCAYCGEKFTPKLKTQKYDRDICRKMANAKVPFEPYPITRNLKTSTDIIVTHAFMVYYSMIRGTILAYANNVNKMCAYQVPIKCIEINNNQPLTIDMESNTALYTCKSEKPGHVQMLKLRINYKERKVKVEVMPMSIRLYS